MSRYRFLFVVLSVLLVQLQAKAQTQDLPKFEVAAEFTTLERDDFNGRTEPGLGGRVTYNINHVFSIEGAGYFFPRNCRVCRNNGRIIQAVGGVKIGKRFENWGIFGKARPGIVTFSDGERNLGPLPPVPNAFEVRFNRLTNFATDIGGVVEFYPSKRIVTRFDVGDTIIYFRERTVNDFRITPGTNNFSIGPVTIPARTSHSFQFMASVGFRF